MATELELKLVALTIENMDAYDIQFIITEMLTNVAENGEQEWDIDVFLEKIGELL